MSILKVVISLISIFFSTQGNAGIKSISSESEVIGKNNTTYRVVSVKCTTLLSKRYIRANVETENWCDTQVEDLCSSSKVAAAKRVCSSHFEGTVENNDDLNNEPKTILNEIGLGNSLINQIGPSEGSSRQKAEQLKLEKQQLLVERELLNVRKKELELLKREIVINKDLNRYQITISSK